MSRSPKSLLPVPHLAPGARLAIVAPSGPFERDTFERAAERLRTRYDVHYGEELFARSGYLAGDDARRARELQAAISDDRVDAILVARGGYGITRILRALDPSPIAERRPPDR